MYGSYIPRKPRRALILGSGALRIGQAGEFDYSGSQAIKALKEEGIYTVLVNPNIATIQTSEGLADRVYFVDVNPQFVEQIIVKEDVDAILLSFGGQSALNCGLELHRRGILEKHGVRVLGTPVETIENTEDRHLFVERLSEIGVSSARSIACHTIDEARNAVHEIELPVMLRGAYSLGGKGSGIVMTESELDDALTRAFDGGIPQVLVEECLKGWKEIEYEVVRDARDNCITVCNMENLDPMGIHTGESIVVAPSQTLNDEEYQALRNIAVNTVRHLGVVGECNIQFALNPVTHDCRVIEVNARLSRSSALASKATGYPLAYVAAKISVGYTLPEIPNSVTQCTTSFFEPALDYLVCKMPRWDISKFQGASQRIGSEMKSVGEVMAIGRTFPEVVQKALRMQEIGVDGLDPDAFEFEDLHDEIENATPRRIFAVAQALRNGESIESVHAMSAIDPWFLSAIADLMRMNTNLSEQRGDIDSATLRHAKEMGFSDATIDHLTGAPPRTTRKHRNRIGLLPQFATIDTTAAEFPAETNYMYTTYHGTSSVASKSRQKKVIVVGSGPYRIGSSVEFDWCCVTAVRTAAELGYETILLNCNPETVSTDYDICDKLVFDEISFESLMNLYEREQPNGVILSMGGQAPNNLAMKLHQAGVRILGTSAKSIDQAENREKFSTLLDEIGIDQPKWTTASDQQEIADAVEELGGYPVLVRPSYVLSGAAMSVAHESHELSRILDRAHAVNKDHPVVISKFETHAREIEIDAVADNGDLILWAMSEHIENAGVHSGDATLVLPPQNLTIETIRKIKRITSAIAAGLEVTGPFNIQFLAKHNVVKVIECNLRASRSFPFVSKVIGTNFVDEATRRMLGVRRAVSNHCLDLNYVAVKAPMFSFDRLTGADPVLGVEMASTGEVGCFGDDQHEALLHAMLATGFQLPKKGVLLSLGPLRDKFRFNDEALALSKDIGLQIFATEGTAEAMREIGVPCQVASKRNGNGDSAMDLIDRGDVDLVINIPREYDKAGRPDGYMIRRRAVEKGIPLVTDLQLARSLVEAMQGRDVSDLQVLAWDEYVTRSTLALD
jgi:carbamoyl-phosphate synthase large subunit